jgi:hypothetical protein
MLSRAKLSRDKTHFRHASYQVTWKLLHQSRSSGRCAWQAKTDDKVCAIFIARAIEELIIAYLRVALNGKRGGTVDYFDYIYVIYNT